MTGTHDIRDATVDNTSRLLTTEYFEYSKAKGALVIIICMDKDGSVNFSRSSYLSIDRNTSLNYTLLIEAPGLCDVFVNDIENDGRLIKGVGYPASRDQFTIAGNSQGEAVHYLQQSTGISSYIQVHLIQQHLKRLKTAV